MSLRRIVLVAACAAALVGIAWTGGVRATGFQELLFRAETSIVSVYATVKDRDGRLVRGLPQEAFQVLDNGKGVQISIFSSSPQPITAAVMLDMSGSMSGNYFHVRDAALALVDVLSGDDRVRIGSFNDEVALSPNLTGDKSILTRVINEELWPLGGTPLWEAIQAGMNSLPAGLSRPVVLVLTDGQVNLHDPVQAALYSRAEQRALEDEFMIYAIGFKGTGLDGAVKRLAERTGGGHFEVAGGTDLVPTFRQLIDELRHQYLLGFVPSNPDGKYHELQVLTRDKSLRVQAREQYFAGARQ